MNLGQLTLDAKQRKKEDDEDIKTAIRTLQKEKYSDERINRLLTKARDYEVNHGGSRANRNVIKACELMQSPDFKYSKLNTQRFTDEG